MPSIARPVASFLKRISSRISIAENRRNQRRRMNAHSRKTDLTAGAQGIHGEDENHAEPNGDPARVAACAALVCGQGLRARNL